MITHIFLDVDGVLNAVRSGTPSQKNSGWKTWTRTMVMGYPIWHSDEMVEALNQLAARDDVQFHWLTTWMDDAKTHLIPELGLNGEDWPILYSKPYGSYWWKLESLNHYMLIYPDIERFVWIDDDHPHYAGAEVSMNDAGHDWLMIAPKTEVGLTRDQFDRIVAFVDRGVEGVLESSHEQEAGQPS